MKIITNHQKEVEIPEAIERYLSSHNTTQAQLARLSGVGDAYVTHIVKRRTKIGSTEIKDKYYEAICRVIGYEMSKKIWRHFNTDNFKLIVSAFVAARQERKRIAIDGDTGFGKSYACEQYKRKYPNGTFVVAGDPLENSKEFCIKIANEVGVEQHGTSAAIIKRVVRKLLEIEDCVLIIDEAEHIGTKSGYVNVVKSLSDGLNKKRGFVLIGMGINAVLREGYEKKRKNFRQTARRFGKREHCFTDISDDIIAICTELGITNSTVHNWLVKRVPNIGDLEIILTDAIKEAELTNQPVSVKLLNSLMY